MTLYQKLFKKFQERSGYKYKPHQEEGMLWCVEREQHKAPFQNIHGGFIADEMGCGKTFMMLSLIVCNFVPRTLIVVPLALVQQWTQSIQNIVGYEPLIYYGYKMKAEAHRLHRASIIITTYGVLSNQYEEDGQLFRINWDRVVYDEAHHMRNRNTKKYEAGVMVPSRIKWLITGTPIQNKIHDLYNLSVIVGVNDAKHVVREDLMRIILKRTKENVGIKLPNVHIHKIPVPWVNKEEKMLYEVLDTLKGSGYTTRAKKSNELSLDSDDKSCGSEYPECIESSCEDEHGLSTLYTSESKCDVENSIDPDVIVAEENISQKMLQFVRSVFGTFKLPYYLRARQMCVCPKLLSSLEHNINHSNLYDESAVKMALTNTTKIEYVVNAIVKNAHNKNKKIVFCSFRKEMDMIKSDLLDCGIYAEIYDGRISRKDRQKVIDSMPDVLILQIQMGCEGLNLQYANEIYFVGPLWNPATEEQAIGRCFRIGQRKPTHVYKFVMTNVDEPVIESMDSYMNSKMSRKRAIANDLFLDM